MTTDTETARPSAKVKLDWDALFDCIVIEFPAFRITVRESTVELGHAVIDVDATLDNLIDIFAERATDVTRAAPIKISVAR